MTGIVEVVSSIAVSSNFIDTIKIIHVFVFTKVYGVPLYLFPTGTLLEGGVGGEVFCSFIFCFPTRSLLVVVRYVVEQIPKL